MRDDELFEQAVHWFASAESEACLRAAREAFEARTGPILEGASDYESRMAHFHEQRMCESHMGPAPIDIFARQHADLRPDARRQLAGWLRSHRSLFLFESFENGQGRVRDLIGRSHYRFVPQGADEQLTPGDRFDGRLLPLAAGLFLSPGRVYHPRTAHAALDELLADPRALGLGRAALLDSLMRMRSRLLSFAAIRAEHVYRTDALDDAYFAASWANPERR